MTLKIKPQGELDFPWLGCGGDDAEAAGVADVGGAAIQRAATDSGQSKIHMVERVEGIGTEPDRHLFGDGEVLGYADIKVSKARSPEVVAGTAFQAKRATECSPGRIWIGE